VISGALVGALTLALGFARHQYEPEDFRIIRSAIVSDGTKPPAQYSKARMHGTGTPPALSRGDKLEVRVEGGFFRGTFMFQWRPDDPVVFVRHEGNQHVYSVNRADVTPWKPSSKGGA
jgi:hypothetical protein